MMLRRILFLVCAVLLAGILAGCNAVEGAYNGLVVSQQAWGTCHDAAVAARDAGVLSADVIPQVVAAGNLWRDANNTVVDAMKAYKADGSDQKLAAVKSAMLAMQSAKNNAIDLYLKLKIISADPTKEE